MLKLFANFFWFYTPGFFQKQFSRIFSVLFKLKVSRLFILPYCLFFGLNSDYLDQFEPESNDSTYQSYSDFFKRKYKFPPSLQSSYVWPCEGYVCDWGTFGEKNESFVKGQKIDLNQIFSSSKKVTRDYFFINVFLHNHNYHRVHSPLNGSVTRILRIPGDLVFLRPWLYSRSDVSYPAFRNERVIFEIKDEQERPWYLALVGGFGVGSIEIQPEIGVGTAVKTGQEIAHFNLGSTVCLASPVHFDLQKFLQKVQVGQSLG